MIIKYSGRFKKEFKKAEKQNKDIKLLKEVIDILLTKSNLPSKYKDHTLSGNYVSYHECHIQSDWLLIYKYENEYLVLYRLGSHSELFS